ncbi:MAG: hypothetical protein J6Q93_04305 [Prevotella sp.]|nr:hypothetical protein [Prevotella sp.]
MLSSDNNIKALRALIDASREYIGLQKSYLRLDVTEKLIRLASATVVLLIVICACLIAVYFLALAATECLKLITGLAMAYAITAFSIITIAFVIYFLRKPLIERPIAKVVSRILLG